MIRVLVVDDNAVIRHGVRALLAAAEDIEVVGDAGDGRAAIAVAAEQRPDVVLLDVRMPIMDGIEAARVLSRGAKVLMLTYGEDESMVTGAIHAGADGYLVHGRFEPEELHRCIRDLAAGATVLSPAVAPVVFEALRRTTPAAAEPGDLVDPLTEREAEIMNLIAQGSTNAEIAAGLFLSEKTVKNHVNHVYAKLGARTRAQATALWLGTAR